MGMMRRLRVIDHITHRMRATSVRKIQFHPKLKSRTFAPHPLFASFVEAAGGAEPAGVVLPSSAAETKRRSLNKSHRSTHQRACEGHHNEGRG
jgi:hypothetical protein